MIDITLRCNINERAELWISQDGEGRLRFDAFDGQGGAAVYLYFAPEDARQMYNAIGAYLRITPAEPDALTRIAVALEALAPVADALTKLASYATEDPLADSARIP